MTYVILNSIGPRLFFFVALALYRFLILKTSTFTFRDFLERSIWPRSSYEIATRYISRYYMAWSSAPVKSSLIDDFCFFSENHLITLPIISHDQKLWNDIKKQPCSFPSVCVCFKERNEESVTYLWWKKKGSIIKQGANHFCIWGVTLVILCISYLLLS